MKTNPSPSKSSPGASKIAAPIQGADLEVLVDELIKSSPNEDRVRKQMLAAGLEYTKDSLERMSLVLQAIEDAKLGTGSTPHGQSEESIKRREREHVQDL